MSTPTPKTPVATIMQAISMSMPIPMALSVWIEECNAALGSRRRWYSGAQSQDEPDEQPEKWDDKEPDNGCDGRDDDGPVWDAFASHGPAGQHQRGAPADQRQGCGDHPGGPGCGRAEDPGPGDHGDDGHG